MGVRGGSTASAGSGAAGAGAVGGLSRDAGEGGGRRHHRAGVLALPVTRATALPRGGWILERGPEFRPAGRET